MAFYCSCGAAGNACNLFNALIFHIKKSDAGSFHIFQHTQRAVDIHALTYVVLLRTALSVYLTCLQAVRLFTGTKIVIKNIIGNTVEPCVGNK